MSNAKKRERLAAWLAKIVWRSWYERKLEKYEAQWQEDVRYIRELIRYGPRCVPDLTIDGFRDGVEAIKRASS